MAPPWTTTTAWVVARGPSSSHTASSSPSSTSATLGGGGWWAHATVGHGTPAGCGGSGTRSGSAGLTGSGSPGRAHRVGLTGSGSPGRATASVVVARRQGGAELVHQGDRDDALLLADRRGGRRRQDEGAQHPSPAPNREFDLLGRQAQRWRRASAGDSIAPCRRWRSRPPSPTAGRGRSGSPAG